MMTAALVLWCLGQTATVEARVETSDDASMRIGQNLRCPVCQGMPIGESTSQMAQDMMTRVREMVAEGKSEAEILDFFVARYGQWVLLAPKPEGMNLTLWFLPPIGLIIGVAIAVGFAKRRRQRPSSPPRDRGATQANDEYYLAAIRREVEE